MSLKSGQEAKIMTQNTLLVSMCFSITENTVLLLQARSQLSAELSYLLHKYPCSSDAVFFIAAFY